MKHELIFLVIKYDNLWLCITVWIMTTPPPPIDSFALLEFTTH
jgi:hypothetical protein